MSGPGRKEILTLDILALAKREHQSALAVSDKYGVSRSAVSQACARHGIKLPRKTRIYPASLKDHIQHHIFKLILNKAPIKQADIARQFSVTRQFVGQIVSSMREADIDIPSPHGGRG